jgi:large subunit ribosomal protein L47
LVKRNPRDWLKFEPIEMNNLRRKLFSASPRRGIEEFIDATLFEGKPLEAVGRRWRLKELRLKSYNDLENLWFVCMKERNMLLTMKNLARMMERKMPQRERLTRVRKSMGRIKKVVEERNIQALAAAKKEFEEKKKSGVYVYPLEVEKPIVQQ